VAFEVTPSASIAYLNSAQHGAAAATVNAVGLNIGIRAFVGGVGAHLLGSFLQGQSFLPEIPEIPGIRHLVSGAFAGIGHGNFPFLEILF
jgi:hypothetical protein